MGTRYNGKDTFVVYLKPPFLATNDLKLVSALFRHSSSVILGSSILCSVMNRIPRIIFKGILEINDASFGFYLFAAVVFATLKWYWPALVASIEIPLGNLFLFLLISVMLKVIGCFQDITHFFTAIQRKLVYREMRLRSAEREDVPTVKERSVQKNRLTNFFWSLVQSTVGIIQHGFTMVYHGILRSAIGMITLIPSDRIRGFCRIPFLLQSHIRGCGFAKISQHILRICFKIFASPRSRLCDLVTKAYSATDPIRFQIRSGIAYSTRKFLFFVVHISKGIISLAQSTVRIIKYGTVVGHRSIIRIEVTLVGWFMKLVGLIDRRLVRGRTPVQLFPVAVAHLFPASIIFYLFLIFLQGNTLYRNAFAELMGGSLVSMVFLGLVWVISFGYIEKQEIQPRRVPNGHSFRGRGAVGVALCAIAGLLIYHYTDTMPLMQVIVAGLGAILIFSIFSLSKNVL